jgi:hypothetical protein
VPLEVLTKDLCSTTKVMYGKFDVLLNRQFTVPSEKRVNNENSPTVDTSQGVYEHLFRFWIAKDATQFTKLFSKHHKFDAKDTMKTFLNCFYLAMFPGEEKELDKLLIDKDIWHLLLIGREQGWENQRAPFLPWKIIAAASFQLIDDWQTIYLSWPAVSSMKADSRQWNTKKTCQQEDVKEFFDGKTFSKGKGIGLTIMVVVQYI